MEQTDFIYLFIGAYIFSLGSFIYLLNFRTWKTYLTLWYISVFKVFNIKNVRKKTPLFGKM